ncbi:hypothetical protein PVK06_005254 [Gossypium arboreum]|uniref:Uncharacterized protein n=1 Tax=Gossypium arboreum TaxID=29729 RepID=A0ABR0QVF1_GOSAR|nr:hypothetical protein PVK06_005254 [Gossypium arboreum]
MLGSATCRRCQNGVENRKHLFGEFPTPKETWEKLNVTWPITDANIEYKDWIKNIFDSNFLFKWQIDSMCNVGDMDDEKQVYSRGESNKVGHILATEGLKRRETTYLMNEVPYFTAKEVDADRRWTEAMNA